ncbi:SDR family oxidoreductase [Thiolapillus brandeum]|uniref:NAD-dependent epimerase/dehydratase n=1 Tax=Thiolapillus brandeum TaxID=1076588 RepID=A0A7U6GKW6_9GAMM|nr:SDR family oxidoreductase [Thiolapillus brandeum]BAO45527.1 NAD-dependent epimerase/dehydratase [Thiolapillus brandeum]
MGNEKALIVGCGYVGLRLAMALPGGLARGLVRSAESLGELERQGIPGLQRDLDQPVEIGWPTAGAVVWYLVPPPRSGVVDLRLKHFLRALKDSGQPRRVVLLSTTGVYGHCQGEWVDEHRPPAPVADRARRRLDAEQQLQQWGEQTDGEWVILRVAGIYGPGKLPLERLRQGKPMVGENEAPWTNRIHAHDLVQVCMAAMERGRSGSIYNVTDGQPDNMAHYFNCVADAAGLSRPPVIDLAQAQSSLSAGMRSYLAESRRIDNSRMLRELGVTLRYPDLDSGLRTCFPENDAIE